jgi:hypothetical protein
MTHRFDAPILDEFARMRRALDPHDRAFVLSDAATVPELPEATVHRFAFASVARRARHLVGSGILHNLHLAWLDLFAAHPQFDHYWFVEYDVRYAGPWRDLIGAFRALPHDLLGAHLRDAQDEPDWPWWHEIRPPRGEIDRADALRGFLPIVRFSRRALAQLSDDTALGWSGFLEGLVPTLLRLRGLRVGDFGGDGPWVPDGFRNRFYTSRSDRAGALCHVGSHRYRPALAYPRIVPGRIYHPVKPEACTIDAGLDAEHAGAAIANLLEQVRQHRLGRELPVGVLLQALAGIDGAELWARIAQLVREHPGDPRYAGLRRRMMQLAEAAA